MCNTPLLMRKRIDGRVTRNTYPKIIGILWFVSKVEREFSHIAYAVAISDGGGSVLTILDLKAWLRNPWKAI